MKVKELIELLIKQPQQNDLELELKFKNINVKTGAVTQQDDWQVSTAPNDIVNEVSTEVTSKSKLTTISVDATYYIG